MPTADPGPRQRFDELPADAQHLGLRVLRRHHEGVLTCFERTAPVKFLVEGSTGKIVLPIEAGFARAGATELVLFCPSESERQFEMSLEPREIPRPEGEECVDRWAGYHGPAARLTWVRCTITGGKTESHVFGTDELELANPLGRAEYALIKQANADKAKLAASCKVHAATLVAEPQCVGVDPLGFDVKARFGIIRVEFPVGVFASSPEAAAAQLGRMLG